MFHECFGVPYMKWYDRCEIEALFSGYSSLDISAIGPNLGRLAWDGTGPHAIGYFWLVQATK